MCQLPILIGCYFDVFSRSDEITTNTNDRMVSVRCRIQIRGRKLEGRTEQILLKRKFIVRMGRSERGNICNFLTNRFWCVGDGLLFKGNIG